MYTRISNYLYAIAGLKSFFVAFAIYMVFGAYIMPNGAKKFSELSGQEVKILDLTFGYTPQQIREEVAKYSPEARVYAAKFGLIADTLYPIAYSFLLIIITAWLYKGIQPQRSSYQQLHMLPVAVVLVDYLENIGLANIHLNYPNISDTLIRVASTLTMIKWSLAIACLVIILIGVVLRIVKR